MQRTEYCWFLLLQGKIPVCKNHYNFVNSQRATILHCHIETKSIHVLASIKYSYVRRVWRYQRGNQNPYIEEEQTTQWPQEKVQKDKQRSTKHTYKTNDRVTRTPLKIGGEPRCSGRVSSSCSTSGNLRTLGSVASLLVATLYQGEKLEGTNGVIKSRKSNKIDNTIVNERGKKSTLEFTTPFTEN